MFQIQLNPKPETLNPKHPQVKTVLSGAVFTLINASAQPADSSILISEVGGP